MYAHEGRIKGGVDQGSVYAQQGAGVAANEYRNRRRGDGVLQQNGGAGQEAPHRPHGPAGKAVAAAGCGDHGGQFRQGKDHAGIHECDQHSGDQHAAEAALGKAKVPAGEVARNDVGHAQPR